MADLHGATQVYATLITSDAYAMGVEALLYSLFKTQTTHPVLVLYTPQVSQATCAKIERFAAGLAARLRVELRCVREIGMPKLTHVEDVHVPGWVNSAYSKLNIFALVEFQKIVYIDADAVVLENVDEVSRRLDSPDGGWLLDS